MFTTTTIPTPEPAHRRFALAGVIVGAVALFGVDLAFAMKATGKHPRTHAAAVMRMVGPADVAVLGAAPVAACTALGLALLLWLGCRSSDSIHRSLPKQIAYEPGDSLIAQSIQSRYSISYHTGGLYGP